MATDDALLVLTAMYHYHSKGLKQSQVVDEVCQHLHLVLLSGPSVSLVPMVMLLW